MASDGNSDVFWLKDSLEYEGRYNEEEEDENEATDETVTTHECAET